MATDYKKFVRDNDVESGVLLGSYNEKDTYEIAMEVKDELIGLRKLITVYKQDYLLCEARILDTTLKFKIKFFVDSFESEKYASAYLLESYSSLGKKIELETFLVNFKTANDHTFLDKLKDKFHLLTQEDLGEGKDIDNRNEILEKLLMTKKNTSKDMITEMGIDNRKYCNDILKILRTSKNYPKLEKIIKERMAGIKADKNTAKYFALLKQILDQIILEYYDDLEEETKKWLDQVNQTYILIYMNKKKEVQKPKQKQQEEAVKKPKKKDEKKKAAGAAKKDNKPKKKPSKGKSNDDLLGLKIEPFLPTFEELNRFRRQTENLNLNDNKYRKKNDLKIELNKNARDLDKRVNVNSSEELEKMIPDDKEALDSILGDDLEATNTPKTTKVESLDDLLDDEISEIQEEKKEEPKKEKQGQESQFEKDDLTK